MRVSVLPWGDPSAWRFAEYCYRNSCAKGFSTLDLLLSSKHLVPDTAVVYALDTLASDSQFYSYGDLVSYVKDYARRFLCVGGEGRVHVEVLPGVLARGGRNGFEFRANLGDTKLLALYTTYFRVLESAGTVSGGSGNFEIILDTTHGVNYFTILVRESVFEATAMVSAALGSPFTVLIFNADPIPSGQVAPERSKSDPCRPSSEETPPRLEYNLLNEVQVNPWDLVRYLRYTASEVGKVLSDHRGCNITEGELKNLLKLARDIVASLRVGALIELVELIKRNQDWDRIVYDVLRRVYDCWLRKAKIEVIGDTRRTAFTKLQDGFRLLLHAHAIFSGVKSVSSPTEVREGVSLKTIHALVGGLLAGSEVTATLVKSELNTIEAMLRGEKEEATVRIPTEWTLYASVLGKERGAECKESGEVDQQLLKRNFIAHAGFLMDFIELRKLSDNDVVFRVRQGCWEVMRRVLDSIFNELRSRV